MSSIASLDSSVSDKLRYKDFIIESLAVKLVQVKRASHFAQRHRHTLDSCTLGLCPGVRELLKRHNITVSEV